MNKKGKTLKLVLPNKKNLRSYLQAVKEFAKDDTVAGDGGHMDLLESKEFDAYFKRLNQDKKGQNLPKGYVAATLFLALADTKVVGRLHLRHKNPKTGGHIGYAVVLSERGKGYAKQILKLGLQKAKKMGIRKIFITCDETNLASKGVILANGGIFARRIKNEGKVDTIGFWIKN